MKIVNDGLHKNVSKDKKLEEKMALTNLNNDILPRSHAPSPPPVNILRRILMCYNEEIKFDTKVESHIKKTKVE